MSQLFTDHLLGSPVDTLETRGLLMERLAAGSLPAAGTAGRTRYLTSGTPVTGGANTSGLGPVYDDGGGWKRYGAPYLSGETFPDFPVATGKLLTGSGAGYMTAVDRSSVLLSELGAPAGAVAFNGQRLTGLGYPSASTDAASKQYVQDVVSNNSSLDPVKLKSNQALPGTWAYSTVNKTLTRTSGTSALTATEIDTAATGGFAYTLLTNDRVLINNQATSAHNGVYVVTNIGGGTNAVLTRATDADTNAELLSPFVYVQAGSFIGSGYEQNSPTFDITVPSGTINFAQVSDSTNYSAGKGLELVGTQFHFFANAGWATGDIFYGASATTLARLSVGASGRFLRSTGSLPAWSSYTLPSGSAYDVLAFNAGGTALEPVASRAANRIFRSDATGVPTWSTDLPAGTTLGGGSIATTTTVIGLAYGGTQKDNSSGPANGVAYKSGSTITIGQSPAGGIAQEFAIWSLANARVEYFDLLGGNLTWTGTQTFAANFSLIGANASPGATVQSPSLTIEGNSNDGGTITRSRWVLQTYLGNPGAAGPLQLSQEAGTSPAPDPLFQFYSKENGTYPGAISLVVGSNILTAGGRLDFQNAGGSYALPSGSAAAYTIAVLQKAQTWGEKQTFQAVFSSDVVLATRVVTDSFDRLTVRSDGQLAFGPGTSGVTDVTLYRGASARLDIGGALAVADTITANSATFTVPLLPASGGTGVNIASLGAAGGLVWRNGGTAGVGAAGISGAIARSGGSGAPTWTAYSLPSGAFTAAGAMLVSTSTTAMAQLIGPADSVERFLTSTNRSLSWSAMTSNPARDAVGVARVFRSRIQGTGSNPYFDVTHNLGTRDVGVFVRKSASAEDDVTGYDQVISGSQVRTTNVVRVNFGYNPSASEYFVVTVVA